MSKRNDNIARAAIEYVHALQHANSIDQNRSIALAVSTTKASQLLSALTMAVPYVDPKMSPLIRSIIMHSLGADDRYPKRRGCRNYYAPPGPGKPQHRAIEIAIEHEWMEWGAPYHDTRYAHVTEAGARGWRCGLFGMAPTCGGQIATPPWSPMTHGKPHGLAIHYPLRSTP